MVLKLTLQIAFRRPSDGLQIAFRSIAKRGMELHENKRETPRLAPDPPLSTIYYVRDRGIRSGLGESW